VRSTCGRSGDRPYSACGAFRCDAAGHPGAAQVMWAQKIAPLQLTPPLSYFLLFTFYFLLLTSYEHSYEQGYEQVMNIFVDNFFCGC
jgi:hypothetical protein